MKICILTLKYGADIGIQPGDSIFNRESIAVFLIFTQNFVLVTANIFYGFDTSRAYEECFFVWITVLTSFVAYLASNLRAAFIYKLIERIGNFIDFCKLLTK